jgi:K+-transporting ATPase ATPase C chain
MLTHLRANAVLIGLTLLLCAVVYPLALWGIGQAAFPRQANGSLIYDGEGKPVGSSLIAQPFTGPLYFQPRPSHAGGDSYDGAGYDAKASGASNWAASNPRLRARVARRLGPIARYSDSPKNGERRGKKVGPYLETWFQENTFQGGNGVLASWAETNPILAQEWVKSDPARGGFAEQWLKDHPVALLSSSAPDLVHPLLFQPAVEQWLKDYPEAATPTLKPEAQAVAFFVHYSHAAGGAWPALVEKKIEPTRKGPEVQSYFFDLWLQEEAWRKAKDGEGYPSFELEQVPADLVMASGSGLDPHITLKNALYQLDGVADAWAEKTGKDREKVKKKIEELLNRKASAPLGGLAGPPLVNVLETNLALEAAVQEVN